MTDPQISALCDDLAAEQRDLDLLVISLSEPDWDLPTPAEGWTIRDQIGHLAVGEDLATLAATDQDAFFVELGRIAVDLDRYVSSTEEAVRSHTGPEILAWWREARSTTIATVRNLQPDRRIPWVGPPMKPLSFLTARLMETFAHGVDVRDALGVLTEPTHRLRHVAHLGVATRAFSYTNRGLQPPETAVRVELTGPVGAAWTWGPEDAPDRVTGPALDFCLVVTQRLNAADTNLQTRGPNADEWLAIAQCFAGPPTDNRPPGAGSISSSRRLP